MTALTSCLNTFKLASPDTTGLSIRGSELVVGVEFHLTVSSISGMGSATWEVAGCCEKTFSRECGVSCFVYAMERGMERTTTEFGRGGAVDR